MKTSLVVAFLCAVPVLFSTQTALAVPRDFDFYVGYSGQYISGRLVGLNLDANGNATEIDPTRVLLFHVPAAVGLAASPSNPYVFVPYTYMRSTYFNGTFTSTVPDVYGFQVANDTIAPASQNLLMIEASGDVTLLFNYGQGLCAECGVATYGIMAEEDALWPAINSIVSFTPLSWCEGDVNGDRSVNLADATALLASFGCASGLCVDVNGDGRTDLIDFAMLQAHFGSSCQ